MRLDIHTGMLKYLQSCTYEEDLPWLQVDDVCWVDFHVDEEFNGVIGRKHYIIQCIIQFIVGFIQSVKQFICLTKRQNGNVTILTQPNSLT